MTAPLVEVRDLTKHFPIRGGFFGGTKGFIHAADGVSFDILPRQTVALVGESGCGKTTTGRMILNLVSPTSGTVRFKGQDIFSLPPEAMRATRRHMQIVFQDPYSSLNPRLCIGQTIEEGLILHTTLSAQERRMRVAELLETVGLSPSMADRFPHEFSGGQRQRIGVARAVSVSPELIVCDEAVSALDVSVQAQVLNLLCDLRERHGIAYLFITHDLSVVRHIADRVVVMYLGHVMEEAPAGALFSAPRHPYTKALLSAAPLLGGNRRERIILQGDAPNPAHPPKGCRFHTRCPWAMPACREGSIPERNDGDRRWKCLLD